MLFMPLCLLAIESEDDRQFIQELYLQFNRLMYREAFRVVQTLEDADDAVSAACVSLIEHLPQLRAVNPQVYPAYIMSTVRNQALMFQRKQKTRRNALQHMMKNFDLQAGPSGDQMDEQIIHHCTLNRMKQMLRTLPEMDQLVLRMKYFEHASDEDIARLLDVRPTTVRSKLMRARRRLYAAMEVDNGEE